MPESLSPEGYAATGGAVCPACGARDLDWHRVPHGPGPGCLMRLVQCEDCGASWHAVYEIAGYEDLQVPHADASARDMDRPDRR